MIEHVDVAVIGLGAMGSATLHQLARRGAAVIGLDRHVPPHDLGSSHGETRITRQALGEGDAYVPLVAESHRIWRALEAETGEALFEACGVLVIGPGEGRAGRRGMPGFTARTVAVAERHGIAHDVIDGAEARRRFPVFVGLGGDETVYHEPGGGYLRPEACIAAQLNRAAALGAEIRTGTEVRAIAQDGGGLRIDTARGPLRADRAVVSAGAWATGLLGQPFGRLLTVRRQLLHWFACHHPGAYAAMPVFIWMHGGGDRDYVYGFPSLPGEARVKLATEQAETATTAEAVDRSVDPVESAAFHRHHVAGRLAGLGPRAVRAAACLYTVTPDRGFIVDRHPDMDRVLVVSACSGHGFKHSAGLGATVAELFSEGRSAIDLAPFALGRFL